MRIPWIDKRGDAEERQADCESEPSLARAIGKRQAGQEIKFLRQQTLGHEGSFRWPVSRKVARLSAKLVLLLWRSISGWNKA